IKMPRHYFNTAIALNVYRKPGQSVGDTTQKISKQLGDYGIRQFCLAFHVPLMTNNRVTPDNLTKNTHLLLTGTYMNYRPQFSRLTTHKLVKAGIGLRYIYNAGKKGVWFAEVSPFVTKDLNGT